MAEGLGLGYATTGLIVAGVILAIAIARKLHLNSVLSFWIIYILTRPLGASIGDYLSQPGSHGGLGLGATITSVIFIGGILTVVSYLSVTKRDVIAGAELEKTENEAKEKGGLLQTVIVVALFLTIGGIGYHSRHAALQSDTSTNTTVQTNGTKTYASSLGDLSKFKTITQDTLDKLNAGDQSNATTRIGDLEYEWDNGQSRLKPKDKATWNTIDGKIDTVLRELRSTHPNVATEKSALEALLAVLN
jgi:hypothetical protein